MILFAVETSDEQKYSYSIASQGYTLAFGCNTITPFIARGHYILNAFFFLKASHKR
jgi:hypothetical protein